MTNTDALVVQLGPEDQRGVKLGLRIVRDDFGPIIVSSADTIWAEHVKPGDWLLSCNKRPMVAPTCSKCRHICDHIKAALTESDSYPRVFRFFRPAGEPSDRDNEKNRKVGPDGKWLLHKFGYVPSQQQQQQATHDFFAAGGKFAAAGGNA
jgi:hypothetical protein